jgi:NarL family two-component system response regulator LiaR
MRMASKQDILVNMSGLRIFVADDHEIVRRVITALLAFHPDWVVCGEAADGREAVRMVSELKPDIILMDIDMPDLDGLEATRQIVQDDPSRKVIVLTMAATEQVVHDVFHAGALGFVLKANATHDLAPAIEAVQRGQTFFTARFAEMILKGYLQEDHSTAQGEPASNERELKAVRLLTEELGITFRHQRRNPQVIGKTAKFLGISVVLLAAAGVWWYVLNGEPERLPAPVDKALVSLGLKSPPPAIDIGIGNPDAKVWIDLRTALYYCAGTSSFGKTPRGKMARQGDALLDHFQPASGQPCN